MNAADIIEHLQLAPHPEGGHFRQTWIADGEGRAAGTSIYFLLQSGEVSHWHRVDADEMWHYYAGAPLVLKTSATDEGPAEHRVLGADLMAGQLPQLLVPKDHWQGAETTGKFTLVGCTVSPAFQFEGFELAAPDFDIPKA